MTIDLKCVFAYMRISSKGQEVGDGLDRQQAMIDRWAQLHQVRVEHPFVDVYTGSKDYAARPGLAELMERLVEGGHGAGTVVVVERPDRLARDLIVGELILTDFRDLGVKVVSAEGDFDLTADDDPTRVLVRQIMAAIAQYDKTSIVQKLRRARERKRLRGERCEGAKPLGHYPVDGPVLAFIMRLGAQGRSAWEIADLLNCHNRDNPPACRMPPRKGRQWWSSAVRKILERQKSGQGVPTLQLA
jgi:DNA invertase Pin-like site-specific DNA recombinase